MMTIEEKIKMYKEKKAFVNGVNAAFQIGPKSHSVESIKYEVYSKQINNEYVTNQTYYREFLVVTFNGGAISARTVTGNSSSANFREIGKLIDGGYYSEVEDYQTLETVQGFEKVEL